ncbi:hypothetical protein HCN44_000873, partial [Aphidius gifuensis]
LNKLKLKNGIQHIEDDVLFQEFGDKGLITLNRPKLNNCVNYTMLEKMIKVLTHWEKTKKVVIINGAGEKVFSSGGDVKALYQLLRTSDTLEDVHQFMHELYSLYYLIGTYKRPIVSLINGLAMGASMGIFFHGKYSVATETTQCGVPEVLVGLIPGFGASHLFQKKLEGVDVKLTGIATHYVSSSKLPEVTKALLAPGDGDVKKILDEYDEQDPHAESCLSKYTKQLDECFSGDSVEDIIQRLKNDDSEWSQGVLKLLDKISPTSLKVAKKAFEKEKELGLVESLKMEFIVAQNMMIKKSDFEEG